MKRTLLFITLITSLSSIGQMINDSVSLNPGYANESYYSLANGEVSNIPNTWDLAFDLGAFGAAIRHNGRQSTLWVYPGSDADWATLDTNGLAANWTRLVNGYDYWSEGALNNASSGGSTDLGWGEYNTVTHQIQGSRIYVLKLSDDSYRKLYVEELASGVYSFKHDALDNSDEVTQTVTKGDYSGKNFVYYDVLTNTIEDREPANDTWDLLFTNYVLELGPGYFGGVTSVLHNIGHTVSEIDDVPSDDAEYNTFDTTIATIGYDWKTFNMSTFSYVIEDSLTYFIKTGDDNVWKLVFTGFGGSSTGKIYFSKEQIDFASIPENSIAAMKVYPNPANGFVNVSNSVDLKNISLRNMSGQLVYTGENIFSGTTQISTSNLENGMYFLTATDHSNSVFTTKILVKH